MVRSSASRLSCSSSDSATPIPTAAAIGRNSVERYVVTIATCEVEPVRRIAWISGIRIERTAA